MKNYTFPKWTELPEIDLYMDQVITYINEKLKDTYFYDEKFITKAMINNYVKTGIVHPPVKKHYTKSHLAYFLVLTILKRCYSMQQITSLLHIYTNIKDSTIEQAYDLFISRFEDSLNDVFKNNRNTILFENANYEQKLMVMSFNASSIRCILNTHLKAMKQCRERPSLLYLYTRKGRCTMYAFLLLVNYNSPSIRIRNCSPLNTCQSII